MKLTLKAIELLKNAFTHNGMMAYSAVDTCEGTMPLWGQLVLAGYVRQADYKSPMGHPFSYSITQEGREFLGDIYSPYDYPFWCQTCSNSFSNRRALVEHRIRKHQHVIPVFPLWPERNLSWRENCSLALNAQ